VIKRCREIPKLKERFSLSQSRSNPSFLPPLNQEQMMENREENRNAGVAGREVGALQQGELNRAVYLCGEANVDIELEVEAEAEGVVTFSAL
jgi:hypothetical protein